VVECGGLALSPGFIDIHSHSDLQVLRADRAKTDQGVTAEVVGNCGFSAFPCGSRDADVREFADPILFGSGEPWRWEGAREYLLDARQRARLCQVESLVGHGTLRNAVAGPRSGITGGGRGRPDRGLAPGESRGRRGRILDRAHVTPRDRARRAKSWRVCCRVAAKADKVMPRTCAAMAMAYCRPIDETTRAGPRHRLPFANFPPAGRGPPQLDKQRMALDKLEQAHRDGIDVAFDSYPYLAGSTVLQQLLPQWRWMAAWPSFCAG